MTDTVYDVIVAGGGVAGTVAAIAAAREGARVLLVERLSRLSGTAVNSNIGAIGLFYAFGKQIISGIGWEWTTRAMQEDNLLLPDFANINTTTNHHNVHVNLPTFCAIGHEMVANANVSLLLHAMPVTVQRRGKNWKVDIACKEGLLSCQAEILIDATGDANLARLAELELYRPPEVQPATFVIKMGGYTAEQLTHEKFMPVYQQGLRQNLYTPDDFGWVGSRSKERDSDGAIRALNFLRQGGGNASHVPSGDASTSEGRTILEQRALLWVLRIMRHFRQIPGMENLRLEKISPEVGVRETDRIVGRTTIKDDDYINGHIYDDAVCYSFYPVDIHVYGDTGLIFNDLTTTPTIPLGAMQPQGEGRFLACGRTIAGERKAFSSYRTMAPCMATGQAAGVIAALAARNHVDTTAISATEWKTALRNQGAIVP